MPESIRRAFDRLLQFHTAKIYQPLFPVLQSWLNQHRQLQVFDLASGAGGPWEEFRARLQQAGWSGEIRLTNRHAGLADTHQLATSVDLLDSSTWPEGALTLFTAFHHLDEHQAAHFLQQLARRKQPVLIAEFTDRRWQNILGMLFSPLLVWVDTLRMRPVRASQLVLTYGVPVLPLMYWWDGTVSHLRTYSQKELAEFARCCTTDDYRFELLNWKEPQSGIRFTGLIGLASTAI